MNAQEARALTGAARYGLDGVYEQVKLVASRGGVRTQVQLMPLMVASTERVLRAIRELQSQGYVVIDHGGGRLTLDWDTGSDRISTRPGA